MITLNIPRPNRKQKRLFLARKKHIGYGGARGGGKSWAVRIKASLLAIQYAGIRICIVRKTYKELEENHVTQLRQMLLGIAKYNQSQKKFTFYNGSTITLQYCSKDKDLDNFQGVEYDIIFIDEATQLSEHQMKVITASFLKEFIILAILVDRDMVTLKEYLLIETIMRVKTQMIMNLFRHWLMIIQP